MLSVIKFTWFDLLIALILMAAPYLMGAVVLFFLIKSFSHSESRIFVKWLVLPQFLATLIMWWIFNFYNAYSSNLFTTACAAMLGGGVMCYILFKAHKSVAGVIIGGHLFALAFFIFLNRTLNPGLYTELQERRYMHQLHDIDQSNEVFNRRFEDVDFRQEMLVKALNDPDMPESTFRGVLARGANPFKIYAFQGSIFSIAVERHNLNALRVFSEQLEGDSEQAKINRLFLVKDNPLDQHLYFSTIPTEEQKQQYKATAKVILDKMPELLNDQVYARILPLANAELIEFLWGYHPPVKLAYRVQAEALMGMLNVADEIAATPGLLKEKPACDYCDSLWEYLVQYAPRPVIQSVLERNVVHWPDYKDKHGENPVLEQAIDRARKYTGDDPQVLTIVMRDILAQRVFWLPSQLAHGFYTEEKGSHVVSALHNAGITCTQLQKALSGFLNGNHFQENGMQRIEEVCGVENKALPH